MRHDYDHLTIVLSFTVYNTAMIVRSKGDESHTKHFGSSRVLEQGQPKGITFASRHRLTRLANHLVWYKDFRLQPGETGWAVYGQVDDEKTLFESPYRPSLIAKKTEFDAATVSNPESLEA